MTVSEVSDKILDENFGLGDLSHSDLEEIDSAPSNDSEPTQLDNGEQSNDDLPEESNEQSDDTLTHWGIKGMKWGVRRSPEELGHKTRKRRFRDRQYEDETPQQHQARLQRESNERAIKTQANAQTKSEKRQLKAKADEQKRQLKSLEKQQQRSLKSQEKARKAQMKQDEQRRKDQQKQLEKQSNSKRQNPKHMSDQELRDAIARVQLEKQYKRATGGIGTKTLGAASDVFGGAGKKIVTALIVTYGTKAATTLIEKQLNKRKKQRGDS